MDHTPENPKTEPGQDAHVDAAWKRLAENKDDNVERTFCYQLFEMTYFNEQLFLTLCEDIEIVIKADSTPKEHFRLLVWIVSCIFRCVFSHFDKADLYKISNFDAEVATNWRDDYLERLRDLLDKIFSAAIAA